MVFSTARNAVTFSQSLPLYLRYIVPACLFTNFAAALQMSVMMGLVLEPHIFIVPTVAGCIFGALFARTNILRGQLEASASTDALTGMHNRKWLSDCFEQCLQNYRRYQTRHSLIMLDIDNFKSINDTHGHSVGDEVICEVARVIRSSSRVTDSCIRWGGEEFIIMLAMTDLEAAKLKAEKLRRSIEEHSFPVVGKVTCSFGVTELASMESSPEELIHRADQALYRAKNDGRNNVQVLPGI